MYFSYLLFDKVDHIYDRQPLVSKASHIVRLMQAVHFLAPRLAQEVHCGRSVALRSARAVAE